MGYCYYDEDFYTEPSEFEAQIDSMKESLAAAVQKKFLDEMEALRKENEALREFREKKEEYDRELEEVKSEYRLKMRDAELTANRKKLKELLRMFSVQGYRPNPNYLIGPKCDKCDDKRRIHFISPMGREMSEDCLCAKRKRHFSPNAVGLFSFEVGEDIIGKCFERNDGREHDRYDYISALYGSENLDYEEINWYRAVFLNEADCQKYCDWLNSKEDT